MLMSITEASKVLGVCSEHIRRMIKTGKWPAYQLGSKATRVDPDEIKGLGKLIAESKRAMGNDR